MFSRGRGKSHSGKPKKEANTKKHHVRNWMHSKKKKKPEANLFAEDRLHRTPRIGRSSVGVQSLGRIFLMSFRVSVVTKRRDLRLDTFVASKMLGLRNITRFGGILARDRTPSLALPHATHVPCAPTAPARICGPPNKIGTAVGSQDVPRMPVRRVLSVVSIIDRDDRDCIYDNSAALV
ncbi:hypothetical protein DMN91_006360 [Ooceraea biroi]|uniref:Uncharacterized protein n=1 Tax=Ooceraea biroi TaxID=2015173 RepID=A0A3L8DNL4_OOCBI|nr:hypothetical protein DMN91_006360 [Ooceraea biroi]